MVIIVLVLVNCDEIVFENLEIFDIIWENNCYIVFGYGSYFCLGVLFVRLEVKIVIIILFN